MILTVGDLVLVAVVAALAGFLVAAAKYFLEDER